MKELMWAVAFVAVGAASFMYVFKRDVNAVNNFCVAMKAGLDVKQISSLADKYDVGLKNIRDAQSIENRTLGNKVSGSEDVWFFTVAAPITVGEHSCGVYHNNKVVLSSKISD